MENYQFVPAYYEWHLVNKDGDILLSMEDPEESLCYETDTNGQLLDEPEPFTTLEEVHDFCKDFIETEKMCVESEPQKETVHGNDERIFDLPNNAADIMAQALFDYYVA